MDKIRILLIEDYMMTRMGLSLVFEKEDDMDLIAEADNGTEGIRLAKELNPDVILMDIGLPDITGIEATQKIKEYNENLKVLIFTSREDENDVFAALGAGADGYIMKGATPQQLTSAIRAIKEGTAWLDPAIAKMVLSSISRQPIQNQTINNTNPNGSSPKNIYGLTERELEVLKLIVDGYSNPQIADKLFITRATAKAHVHSILQKLYVKDRTQAAVWAMKEGIV